MHTWYSGIAAPHTAHLPRASRIFTHERATSGSGGRDDHTARTRTSQQDTTRAPDDAEQHITYKRSPAIFLTRQDVSSPLTKRVQRPIVSLDGCAARPA